MKKNVAVFGFIVVVCMAPVLVRADTVVLKSGKQVEGVITEETKDYIAVTREGAPIYYDRKYIERIDKGAIKAPDTAQVKAPESAVPSAAAVEEAMEAVNADERGFMERGLDAGIAKKFDEAAAILREGLKVHPDDDQMSGALDVVEKARQGKVSADYAVNMFQGFKCALSSDYSQAKTYLEAAYKISPDDVDLNYNLGIIEYETEEYAAALKYLQKVADAEPDSGEAYGRIGNTYYMLGDYQKAQENLMIAMMLFRKAGDIETAGQISAALEEIKNKEKQ